MPVLRTPPISAIELARKIKAPLKLFVYRSKNGPETLRPFMKDFPQHLEGEEYRLMDVGSQRANFDYFTVPKSGSATDVVFAPLQLGLGAGAS